MSLQLILVRHAPAPERDRARWPDDRKRPLSPEGRAKFEKAATGLVQWIPEIDRLLTSPFKRARETADILHHNGWPRPEDMLELVPQSSPSAAIGVLREMSGQRIALVGHEPNLSALLAACIGGSGTHAFTKLKKGGAACIYYPGKVAAGGAKLTEFVPPRFLRVP